MAGVLVFKTMVVYILCSAQIFRILFLDEKKNLKTKKIGLAFCTLLDSEQKVSWVLRYYFIAETVLAVT